MRSPYPMVIRWPPMPRNILVVDDNAELREILRALLELDGHSVRAAKDAAEAIGLMGEQLAGCVVIDEDLHDMSGSHLACHLKAMAETLSPKLNFVAIAIRGDLVFGDETTIDGFDHLLYKPVAYEQLTKLLGSAP